jgi:hypothetical protein
MGLKDFLFSPANDPQVVDGNEDEKEQEDIYDDLSDVPEDTPTKVDGDDSVLEATHSG